MSCWCNHLCLSPKRLPTFLLLRTILKQTQPVVSVRSDLLKLSTNLSMWRYESYEHYSDALNSVAPVRESVCVRSKKSITSRICLRRFFVMEWKYYSRHAACHPFGSLLWNATPRQYLMPGTWKLQRWCDYLRNYHGYKIEQLYHSYDRSCPEDSIYFGD